MYENIRSLTIMSNVLNNIKNGIGSYLSPLSQQSSSIHNVSIANNEQTRTTAKRNRNRNRKKNSNIARRE